MVDHNKLNPSLGGREDFLELIGALKERGMGLLQDMVPNHMAYSIENQMLVDVLERGERSRYLPFFDVDWSYRYPGIRGRILAPFLGEHYGDALEKGEISLTFSQSGFAVDYHGLLFPLRLKSYAEVLGLEREAEDQEIEATLGVISGAIRELALKASESPDVSESPEDPLGPKRWRRMNEPRRRDLNGRLVPDRNEKYSLYQSLIGALPFFQDIMEPSTDFFEDFIAFQRNVALYGMQNSLSQTLLKIASPGVPDFYQGTELWDFSFVDPDNRRPVDFDLRRSYLEDIKRREDIDLMGLIKELMAKRANADLFRLGRYLPLEAEGMHKEKIVAFARVHDGSWALALSQRFPASREASWGDTSLVLPKTAPARWRDAVTGKDIMARRISLEDAFEHFPVALLMGRVG